MLSHINHFDQANMDFDAGDWVKAIKNYQLCLEINPLCWGAIFNLALSFYELGDYRKAIIACNTIINSKENPLKLNAIFTRGNCYQASARFQEAWEDFSAVIQIEPNNTCAYYNRANALRKLNRLEEAEADIEIVELIEGERLSGGEFCPPEPNEISDEHLDRFNQSLQELEHSNPYNLALMNFEKGNAYAKIREFGIAVECYRTAIQHYPQEFYREAQQNLIYSMVDSKQPMKLINKEIEFYVQFDPENEIIQKLIAENKF